MIILDMRVMQVLKVIAWVVVILHWSQLDMLIMLSQSACNADKQVGSTCNADNSSMMISIWDIRAMLTNM
jgi:hypothetical protein